MNLSNIPAIFINDVEIDDIPADSARLGGGCATPPPYALLFPREEEEELQLGATFTPPSYGELFPAKMEEDEEDAVSINSGKISITQVSINFNFARTEIKCALDCQCKI